MAYEALVDKSQFALDNAVDQNYIRNFLQQPRFVRPSERAPNPKVIYTRLQRRLPHTEYEDVVCPSQPTLTRHTRCRNDNQIGSSQQQTQSDFQTLPPLDRGRRLGGGRGRRDFCVCSDM